MEENSKVELVTMYYWEDYLSYMIVWLLALPVLTIIYFSIKRRYTSTQTLAIEQNFTEESEIYTSSENVFNESSFESLNLELEKKNVSLLSKYIDTEDKRGHILEDSLNYNELFCTTSKFDVKKTMDTVHCNYGYSEDEIQECNNCKQFEDVLESTKLNSDSCSTINSWKSCNKDISHSESDHLNSLSSENLEISQPLNLCIKDNKNETETIKKKTFFTDRRHKKSKDKLMVDPENYFCSESIKDEQNILKVWNKLKNEYILKNTKIHSSLFHDKMKNLNYLYNKEYFLNIGKLEHSLENTEYGIKHENHLEISKVSTINNNQLENEGNLDNTELSTISYSELKNEEHLDNTELSTINISELENESNLDNTELSTISYSELKNEEHLDNIELSTINYSELKNEEHLENTILFSINHNELKDEYNLGSIKCSLNEDELMLENNLETTEISAINRDESLYEYYLESPELSSLNNDKSISGTNSYSINCINEETQGITDLNSSSSESTESLPSPIYQNNNSIDDIRYIEDYNDISYFDPSLSEDAMNQAFVED